MQHLALCGVNISNYLGWPVVLSRICVSSQMLLDFESITASGRAHGANEKLVRSACLLVHDENLAVGDLG